MAKVFDPQRPRVTTATRIIEARKILAMLAEHDVADKIKNVYPRGSEFIEGMAVRLAIDSDPIVTEKQLEFLRGLCERNVGHLPEDEDPKRVREGWKK